MMNNNLAKAYSLVDEVISTNKDKITDTVSESLNKVLDAIKAADIELNNLAPAINPKINAYLTDVTSLLNTVFTDNQVELLELDRTINLYAYQAVINDNLVAFAIQFALADDPILVLLEPNYLKADQIHQRLVDRVLGELDVFLLDNRIILIDNKVEAERTYEMANAITKQFQMVMEPNLRQATVSVLESQSCNTNWNIVDARRLERSLSPHGAPPRMDVAMVMKIPVQNSGDMEPDYRDFGVIGGYTEFLEKEVVNIPGSVFPNTSRLMYQPIFHITVCESVIPNAGSAAILLSAFVPSIYSSKVWLSQWANKLSGEDAQPGQLEVDIDNDGRPYGFKNHLELSEFADAYFLTPQVVIDNQNGRSTLPYDFKVGVTQGHYGVALVKELTRFFGSDSGPYAAFSEISRFIGEQFDGVYSYDKGRVIQDSRRIDYLTIASTSSVGDNSLRDKRNALLKLNPNPTLKARIVEKTVESFVPLYVNNVLMINPDFIKWILTLVTDSKLTIVDESRKQSI